MAHSKAVSVEMDRDIAWVTIDNPPVNATSTAVRAELLDAVATVAGARIAVLICTGRTFIAGGDISEFSSPPAPPDLPDVVQAIEDSDVPFLATMHGTVLGGGLEIAMGCAWRIAAKDTRFGLPEVNIGLIPGAGGSQRLPRLIGMDASIDMAAGGQIIDAEKMRALGGIDAITQADPKDAALAFISDLPDRPMSISQRPVAPMPEAALSAKRTALEKRARGQASPLHNLDALTWSTQPFPQGQPKERALHLELRKSPESHALRHAFFAERAVAKPKAIEGAKAHNISKMVVVGGGLMGAGIASAALGSGLCVTLIERNEVAAKDAEMRVHDMIDGAFKRGKIDGHTRDTQKTRLTTSTNLRDARDHDLAIEAVFEDIAVKRDVFKSLADVMPADALLATNTSYLDPNLIFAGIPHPARCLGLHFFSPAHIMKLIEVIRLPETAPDTLATGFALAKKMRKVAVLSGICDGFIGNRMLLAYRRAAEYMLADGALPEQIDAAMRDFGMAMGPFEAQDMSGLQIALANRRRLDATRDPAERYVPISDRLCDLNRFGQRAGKGWYRYEGRDRTPRADPEVRHLIERYSDEAGISRTPPSDADIQFQLLAILANEGAKIIEEGVAETAAAVDMVKLFGYGFPRWKGGPMHAADSLGKAAILTALDQLDQASPGSWTRAARYERTAT